MIRIVFRGCNWCQAFVLQWINSTISRLQTLIFCNSDHLQQWFLRNMWSATRESTTGSTTFYCTFVEPVFWDYGRRLPSDTKNSRQLPKSVRGKLFVLDQAWVWVTKGLSRLDCWNWWPNQPVAIPWLVVLWVLETRLKQPFCCLFHFRHICHIVVILYSLRQYEKPKDAIWHICSWRFVEFKPSIYTPRNLNMEQLKSWRFGRCCSFPTNVMFRFHG